MAIPLRLLHNTEDRALCFCIYGNSGLRKTNAICTLPPPILLHDFEGGTISLLPWIRRKRMWDSPKDEWINYTDEDRQQAYDSLTPENKAHVEKVIGLRPRPYIDVVRYSNLKPLAYQTWVQDLAHFDLKAYNSVACDSLQEQSGAMATAVKGGDNIMGLKGLPTNFWNRVQDQNAAALRYYRDLRDQGVFVYLTCSEAIDKAYVTDPRSTDKGEAPEKPYDIKGSVNLSGKMVNMVQHITDILMRTRKMGDNVRWMRDPEAIGASGAMWESKDRTGRITEAFNPPNIRYLMTQIYGDAVKREIYHAAITNNNS